MDTGGVLDSGWLVPLAVGVGVFLLVCLVIVGATYWAALWLERIAKLDQDPTDGANDAPGAS